MATNAVTLALIALSDDDAAIADRLVEAVNSPSNIEGLSRSAAARKAKTNTMKASQLLSLMAAAEHINCAGNGAWVRYHARRR